MDDESNCCSLLILAKAPVPGSVKTRMQPYLDVFQSALLHKNLVEHCLATVTNVPWMKLELCVGSHHEWWESVRGMYSLTISYQDGVDLGQRMYNAADVCMTSGRSFEMNNVMQNPVIIIGTDCPYIDGEYLQQAKAALVDNDVVLGPANDGGYVLIGFKSLYRWLFCDIEWGSDRVLAQTRSKLIDHGVHWHELPFLSDIDRPEDLRLLKKEMPQLLVGI
jgi:rSAM/selenodomain-associated transferase 1